MIIRSEKTIDKFKIFIDDITHFEIKKHTYRGLQSWIDKDKYCVEVYSTDIDPVKLEYNTFEKWKEIIKQFDLI